MRFTETDKKFISGFVCPEENYNPRCKNTTDFIEDVSAETTMILYESLTDRPGYIRKIGRIGCAKAEKLLGRETLLLCLINSAVLWDYSKKTPDKRYEIFFDSNHYYAHHGWDNEKGVCLR